MLDGIGAVPLDWPPVALEPYHNKLWPPVAFAIKDVEVPPIHKATLSAFGALGVSFILIFILLVLLHPLAVIV